MADRKHFGRESILPKPLNFEQELVAVGNGLVEARDITEDQVHLFGNLSKVYIDMLEPKIPPVGESQENWVKDAARNFVEVHSATLESNLPESVIELARIMAIRELDKRHEKISHRVKLPNLTLTPPAPALPPARGDAIIGD